jgi:hypothetical protein
MPTTDLTPGTITTLGALRPGDVGEFVSGHGSGFSFVVTEVERDLTWIRSVHDKAAWPRQHLFRDAVRYLGRGRIEPAKIVLEGESDPTIEQTVLRVLAAAVGDGIVTYDRDPTRLTAGELVGAANVLNDAMGEQQRRVAELEEQVRALQKLVKPKSDIPCCVKCGRWMSEHWDFPDRCEGFVIPETIELTIAATAPKEKPCTT